MNYLRFTVFGVALAGGLLTTSTASAAWDNVFQVCCHDCGGTPRASYSAPAPACCPQACPQACPQPCPCPQPEVRVSYVQRCFYQPVTEYVQKCFYEPVQKNYTSYYYEPVTEYKYSTFYDPCTCCPQKVCTPVTSYRLRSQCNSVTSYVMRTACVPVTTLRPVTVQQPVVSYYMPPQPTCCPQPQACCPSTGAAAAPGMSAPGVQEFRSNPPSVIPQVPGSDTNIPNQMVPTAPMNTGSLPRSAPTVNLRPEKTASRSSAVTVRGEVVLKDQVSPRSNVKLVFVNADKPEQKEYVTANGYGEFDVRLASGNWYIYVGGENGQATYHKKVSLGDRDNYDFKVVSR